MTAAGVGHPGACVLCGARLKRNGTTSAGRTRWRCTRCGASSTRSRPDVARQAELEAFVAWLSGRATQADLDGGTGRTFRDRHAWCWDVDPTVAPTGVVHAWVQLDGIYLSGGWCALIALGPAGVIAWQWCDTEKTAAWTALLQRVPAPDAVVVDGGSGLLSALRAVWPGARVQRCLVHVQRDVRRHLTTRPRTPAGRALWALAKALTKVDTLDKAAAWLARLNDWHTVHGHLVRARTYRAQVTFVPGWVRPGQAWWYTHDRLRKAYRGLERLARDQTLFTHLDPDLPSLAATTNKIEGGVNACLRAVLRHHRGMPTTHRRRAIDWWCHQHSENPTPLADLARLAVTPAPEPAPDPDQHDHGQPAGYDTGLTAEEGLWTRQGWAGRV